MFERVATLLLAIATILGIAGCGGMFLSGATPLTPPTIGVLQAEPTRLRFHGGQVALTVEVHDADGLQEVVLWVILPDGSRSPLPMNGAGQDRYRATVTLPPNLTANPQQYQVFVEAKDRFGVSAQSSPQILIVEPIALPPSTPPI